MPGNNASNIKLAWVPPRIPRLIDLHRGYLCTSCSNNSSKFICFFTGGLQRPRPPCYVGLEASEYLGTSMVSLLGSTIAFLLNDNIGRGLLAASVLQARWGAQVPVPLHLWIYEFTCMGRSVPVLSLSNLHGPDLS